MQIQHTRVMQPYSHSLKLGIATGVISPGWHNNWEVTVLQQVLPQFTLSRTSPGFCPIWHSFRSSTVSLQASDAPPPSCSSALISTFIAFAMDGEGTEHSAQQCIWRDCYLLRQEEKRAEQPHSWAGWGCERKASQPKRCISNKCPSEC